MIEWQECNKPLIIIERLISSDGKWLKTIDRDDYVRIWIADYSGFPTGFAKNEHYAWEKLLKSCDASIHQLTTIRAEVADIIQAQKENGK